MFIVYADLLSISEILDEHLIFCSFFWSRSYICIQHKNTIFHCIFSFSVLVTITQDNSLNDIILARTTSPNSLFYPLPCLEFSRLLHSLLVYLYGAAFSNNSL